MTGVYVCANIEPFNAELKKALSVLGELAGSKVGAEKLHATIVYSKTDIDREVANTVLDLIEPPFKADVTSAACFDALPADDGTRDVNLSTIVLKLESHILTSMYETFKSIGATSSYPTYEPHVSVWYNVPKELAKEAVDRFNSSEPKELSVTITSFHMEDLQDDWVKGNTKAR